MQTRGTKGPQRKDLAPKFRFSGRMVWLVGLAIVVGGLALAARPLYRYIRDKRVDAILEKAKAAARQEDWPAVRSYSRTVLLARRNDFEAFRLWSKSLASMGEPRAYLAATDLFIREESTREDKLEAFRVLCLQAPDAIALGAYGMLSKEEQVLPSTVAALVPLLARRGEVALAEKLLRSCSDLDNNPALQRELTRLLCAFPNPDRIKEARKILATLMERDSADGLQVLLFLNASKGGLAPGDPLQSLPKWVESRTDAKVFHRLAALEPEIGAQPDTSEAVFQAAIDRFLKTDPGVLGTWLIAHGRAGQARELLVETAKTDVGAYLAWVHALMRDGGKENVLKALETPPESANVGDVELIRATFAHSIRDQTTEKMAWNRVLEQAVYDQTKNRFLEISQYAAGIGAREIADDAQFAAVRLGWGPIPLFKDLKPLCARLIVQDRSEDLLLIFRTLLRLEPGNPELWHNFLYLALLHGVVPPDAAMSQLEELFVSNPEMPQIQAAVAVAALLAGDSEKALRLAKSLESVKQLPRNDWQILYAVSLAANKDPGAEDALAKVVWKNLLRQEAIVFRRFLVGLNVKDTFLPVLAAAPMADNPENTPAWKSALKSAAELRAGDVLPPLPAPKLPVADLPPLPAPKLPSLEDATAAPPKEPPSQDVPARQP